MALALQVVSSHLLGVLDIESALSTQPALVDRLLPHAASEADALKRPNSPRLFLLDGCSLTFPLGPLCGRLRANSPGSKFLALLAPDRSGETEMIRLFHWGIDGMLVLDKKMENGASQSGPRAASQPPLGPFGRLVGLCQADEDTARQAAPARTIADGARRPSAPTPLPTAHEQGNRLRAKRLRTHRKIPRFQRAQ